MSNYPPGDNFGAPWLESGNDCIYVNEFNICFDCPELDWCKKVNLIDLKEWKEENGK